MDVIQEAAWFTLADGAEPKEIHLYTPAAGNYSFLLTAIDGDLPGGGSVVIHKP
jgi:hypothetical protein